VPITFENESAFPCPESSLRALAAHAISYMALDERVELSILAVDEEEMSRLHVEWMDEEGPTDVLSFPIDELRPGQEFIEGSSTLGDVVLCPVVAQRQAQIAGHTAEAELEILLVHGILHLMGFDHSEPAEEQEMFGLQQKIINDWKAAS
jgi:probable rRNA maturation factor